MKQTHPPRYTPQTATRQIRPRSQEVVNYHYDEQKPGKPLILIIPGAMIALTALGFEILLGYFTFSDARLNETLGTALMLALFPIYVGGVFMFSYGYELYDIPKAIRLTVIIVFITLAAVFMFVVLIVILKALGDGKSDSSSSSSHSSSSSGGGSSSRSGGGFLDGIGTIFVNTGSTTHTVTREIVREVPVPPPAPQPIACSHCGRSYLPAENKYACPNCGAPAPPDLVPQ
jgi:hypothetical protein